MSTCPCTSLADCTTVERLTRERNEARLRVKYSESLADEVAVLVRRKVLDSRSPAADALLDFREPPTTPRADRMAMLEQEVEQLRVRLVAVEGELRYVRSQAHGGATRGGAALAPAPAEPAKPMPYVCACLCHAAPNAPPPPPEPGYCAKACGLVDSLAHPSAAEARDHEALTGGKP